MRKTLAIVFVVLAFASSAYAMVLAGVISSYRVPKAPNVPTGVTATAGNTQNTVSWTASAVDGTHDAATSYTLYGGTSASPTSSIYTGSATSYTHTGLTNGTPYYYRLTASNPGGTSAYSSPDATATPTVTWTDIFTASAWSSYPRWTASTAGDGSWSYPGTGITASSAGHLATSAAMVYLNGETLDRSTKQFKVTVQLTGSTTYGSVTPIGVIGLVDASKGTPSATSSATAPYSTGRLFETSLTGVSGSPVAQMQYYSGSQWYVTTASNTWATTGGNNFDIVLNANCVIQIDTTATTVKMTLYQSDGTTVIASPPAVNWTGLNGSPTAANLYIGDPWGDYYYPAFKIISVARTL